MGGGAWPFPVGGVICQVNSDNERDLNLLNSVAKVHYPSGFGLRNIFLEGLFEHSEWKFEAKTGL